MKILFYVMIILAVQLSCGNAKNNTQNQQGINLHANIVYQKVPIFTKKIDTETSVVIKSNLLSIFPANLVINGQGEIFYISYLNYGEQLKSAINRIDKNGGNFYQIHFDDHIKYLAVSKKNELIILSGSYDNASYIQTLSYALIPQKKYLLTDPNSIDANEQGKIIDQLFQISDYNNKFSTRKIYDVYTSATETAVRFTPALVGIDGCGNRYYNFAAIKKNPDSGLLEPDYPDHESMKKPNDSLIIWSKDKKTAWEKRFPNVHGGVDDINALGGRSFFITPSGIIYMMTVTLTHLYIEKYVPEPVAKKAGGADKAYY